MRSTVGAMILAAVLVSCGEPASTLFQPTLEAARAVARQRHGGDLIVFVSDQSAGSRLARRHVFGATPEGRFVAANFAAVEVRAGSPAAREVLARYQAPEERAQIIVVSERLNNLRIHVLRLDRIKDQPFLEQLQTIKRARTIDDYRRSASGTPARGK